MRTLVGARNIWPSSGFTRCTSGAWLVPTTRISTGAEIPKRPLLSVALAVNTYAPGGTLVQARRNGPIGSNGIIGCDAQTVCAGKELDRLNRQVSIQVLR